MKGHDRGTDDPLEKLRDGSYDVTEGIVSSGPERMHDGHPVSVRRAEHAGHTIEIETTYRILIDGVEFPDPIHVENDGSVRYHGLPQYSSPSAIELMKRVVERMADGEPPPLVGAPGPGHGSGGHGGG